MAVAQRYTKKQVNRAGKLLAALFVALRSGDRDGIAEHEAEDIGAAIDAIDWWRSLHAAPLARVNAGLRYYLREIHDEPPTQRLKKFSTIVNKLEREPRMQLTTMQDIGGVRAILPDQRSVDAVVSRLERNWGDSRPGRSCIHKVRDYVRKPKADGYRAVHVIVRSREGFFVEVQLRTSWQDSWAQSVEFDTRELDVGLKFGLGPSDLREYYAVVSELVAMREAHVEPPEGFLEQLRELQKLRSEYYAKHRPHG